jgi:hypothetical protein
VARVLLLPDAGAQRRRARDGAEVEEGRMAIGAAIGPIVAVVAVRAAVGLLGTIVDAVAEGLSSARSSSPPRVRASFSEVLADARPRHALRALDAASASAGRGSSLSALVAAERVSRLATETALETLSLETAAQRGLPAPVAGARSGRSADFPADDLRGPRAG